MDNEGRPATPDEQRVLARWAGWGSLSEPMWGENANHAKTYAAERAALAELLTPEETAAARRNTLNAHYTDAAIVQAAWEAIEDLGFTGGQVLDPGSGSGNFMGFAPDGARMVGVELDPTTAKISRYLYPHATVVNTGLEDFNVPDGTFDAAIGNVPFSSKGPYDRVFNPDRTRSLHDFAILKSIAKVRPGGLVALVTSNWTLDRKDSTTRQDIYDKADLVGAVRLPSGAHERTAGTGVLTDLLVFRRRKDGEPKGDKTWLQANHRIATAERDGQLSPLEVNGYWRVNPDLVLGEMGKAADLGTRGLRSDQEIVVKGDKDNVGPDLQRALADVVRRGEDRGLTESPRGAGDTAPEVADLLQATSGANEGSLLWDNDRFRVYRGGLLVDVKVPKTQHGKTKRLLALRDLADELLTIERSSEAGDEARADLLRTRLSKAYDTYVARYGAINDGVWRASVSDARLDEPHIVGAADLEAGNIIVWPGVNAKGTPLTAVVVGVDDAGKISVDVIGRQGDDRAQTLDPNDGQRWRVIKHRTWNYYRKRQLPAAFESDPLSGVVINLESYDPETNTAVKGRLLKERSLSARTALTNVDDPETALSMVLDADGQFSLGRVAQIMGLDEEGAWERLRGHIFRDPHTGEFKAREEYLSGDVRQALRDAEAAAQSDPDLRENVDALLAVQPEFHGPDRIEAKLGASWIPEDLVQQFLRELVDDPTVTVKRGIGARWNIENRGRSDSDTLVGTTWGTDRKSAYDLVDSLLHQKKIRVTTLDASRKPQFDKEETDAANTKAADIAAQFREWLFEDPERADQILRDYNDAFNTLVKRQYSDAPMHPEGMSDTFELYPHQAQAIRRMLNEPAVLIAHEVGAGKTLELASAAMELKRRGLAKKPMILVPNHMKEQWQREFLTAFPQARLLAISGDDVATPAARREYLAKAATGEWDAIITTHSTFGSIKMSKGAQRRYIDGQMAEQRAMLDEARAVAAQRDDKKSASTVKKMEEALLAREGRLMEKLDKQSDSGLTFEQLGVDYLMVDEAHLYKNLERASMTDEGIDGSDMASDLDMKLGYLRDTNTSGRYVTFATATPVSNSFGETHTVLRYLRPDLLEGAGVHNFDTFLANFARMETKYEQSADGSGFVEKHRIRSFTNAVGLFRMWQQVADVLTAEDLDLDVPDIDHGTPEMILVRGSDWLADYGQRLKGRAEAARKDRRRKGADNILVINNDGSAAALDPRMVGGPEDPNGGKIGRVADEAAAIYEETKDNVYLDPATNEPHPRKGSLQLMFLDIGTPGSDRRYAQKQAKYEAALAKAEAEGLSEDDDDFPAPSASDSVGFDAYAELKRQMVARGIPEDKIAFMHDAKGDDAKKAKLFARARTGEIAVLLGSTALMGVGTNVQDRAVASHDVDVPYRPSDLRQRRGRGIRQKNQNSKFRIFQYATEGSLDARKWEIQSRKDRFIGQLMKGDLSIDAFEELSPTVLSADEMAAAASGNPVLLQMVQTDADLQKVRNARKSFENARRFAAHTIERSQVEEAAARQRVGVYDTVIPSLKKAGDPDGYYEWDLQIGDGPGKPEKRIDAVAGLRDALMSAYDQRRGMAGGPEVVLGRFGGYQAVAQAVYSQRFEQTEVHVWFPDIPGVSFYLAGNQLGTVDMLARVDNAFKMMPWTRDMDLARISEIQRDRENARKQLAREFRDGDKLAALEARKQRLTALQEWMANPATLEDGQDGRPPADLVRDSPEVEAVIGAAAGFGDDNKEPRPTPTSLANINDAGEFIPRSTSHLARKRARELADESAAKATRTKHEKYDGPRNPEVGKRIGDPQTRPLGSDGAQVFETLCATRPGTTRDRVSYNIQRGPRGFGVFKPGESEAERYFPVLDKAKAWAVAETAKATPKASRQPNPKVGSVPETDGTPRRTSDGARRRPDTGTASTPDTTSTVADAAPAENSAPDADETVTLDPADVAADLERLGGGLPDRSTDTPYAKAPGDGSVSRYPANVQADLVHLRGEDPTVGPDTTPDPEPAAASSPFDDDEQRAIVRATNAEAGRYSTAGGDPSRYVAEGHLKGLVDKHGLSAVADAVRAHIDANPDVLTRKPRTEAEKRADADAAEQAARDAGVMASSGDYDEALRMLDEVERLDPDHRIQGRNLDDIRAAIRGKRDERLADAPDVGEQSAADAPVAPKTNAPGVSSAPSTENVNGTSDPAPVRREVDQYTEPADVGSAPEDRYRWLRFRTNLNVVQDPVVDLNKHPDRVRRVIAESDISLADIRGATISITKTEMLEGHGAEYDKRTDSIRIHPDLIEQGLLHELGHRDSAHRGLPHSAYDTVEHINAEEAYADQWADERDTTGKYRPPARLRHNEGNGSASLAFARQGLNPPEAPAAEPDVPGPAATDAPSVDATPTTASDLASVGQGADPTSLDDPAWVRAMGRLPLDGDGVNLRTAREGNAERALTERGRDREYYERRVEWLDREIARRESAATPSDASPVRDDITSIPDGDLSGAWADEQDPTRKAALQGELQKRIRDRAPSGQPATGDAPPRPRTAGLGIVTEIADQISRGGGIDDRSGQDVGLHSGAKKAALERGLVEQFEVTEAGDDRGNWLRLTPKGMRVVLDHDDRSRSEGRIPPRRPWTREDIDRIEAESVAVPDAPIASAAASAPAKRRKPSGLDEVTFHELYGKVTGRQLRAYKKHNVPPATHDALVEHYGEDNHAAIAAAVVDPKNHAPGSTMFENFVWQSSLGTDDSELLKPLVAPEAGDDEVSPDGAVPGRATSTPGTAPDAAGGPREFSEGDRVELPDGREGWIASLDGDDAIVIADGRPTPVTVAELRGDVPEPKALTASSASKAERLSQASTPEGTEIPFLAADGAVLRLRNLDTSAMHGEIVDVAGNVAGWIRGLINRAGRIEWRGQVADHDRPTASTFVDGPLEAASSVALGQRSTNLAQRTTATRKPSLSPAQDALVGMTRGDGRTTVTGTYLKQWLADGSVTRANPPYFTPEEMRTIARLSERQADLLGVAGASPDARRTARVLRGAAKNLGTSAASLEADTLPLPKPGAPDPFDGRNAPNLTEAPEVDGQDLSEFDQPAAPSVDDVREAVDKDVDEDVDEDVADTGPVLPAGGEVGNGIAFAYDGVKVTLTGKTFTNRFDIARAGGFELEPAQGKRGKQWVVQGTPQEQAQALRRLAKRLGAPDPIKAATGGGPKPTPQQQAVIDDILAGRTVVVRALAGTGKTSTLEAAARALEKQDPNKRIAYIAFNRTVREEADRRMPGNVENRTQDALAFRGTRTEMAEKYDRHKQVRAGSASAALVRPDEVAKHLGILGGVTIGNDIPLTAPEAAAAVMRAIEAFSISADDQLDAKHLPIRVRPAAMDLLPFAEKAWEDLNDPQGRLRYTNSHITKQWALTKPDLSKRGCGLTRPADVIFFDEAQDINPVMAKVIADQKLQKVYVGDSNQAIYGFRGAVDELDKVEVESDRPLTKSWRFGPEVADIGNRFLQLLDSQHRVEGGGPSSRIHEPDTMKAPDAILVRSNSGAIASILDAQGAGRIVGVPQGTKGDLASLVRTARWLMRKSDSEPMPERIHEDFAAFRTWKEVQNEVEKPDVDAKLKMLHGVVERNGVQGLDAMVRDLRDLGDKTDDRVPDVVVTTAHKAKGLEWDRVRIGSDFRGPKVNEDGAVTEMPPEEELRLTYVAVTRAKKELDPGSLAWVFDHTDENGGIPGMATTNVPAALRVDTPAPAIEPEAAGPAPTPTVDVDGSEPVAEDFLISMDAPAPTGRDDSLPASGQSALDLGDASAPRSKKRTTTVRSQQQQPMTGGLLDEIPSDRPTDAKHLEKGGTEPVTGDGSASLDDIVPAGSRLREAVETVLREAASEEGLSRAASIDKQKAAERLFSAGLLEEGPNAHYQLTDGGRRAADALDQPSAAVVDDDLTPATDDQGRSNVRDLRIDESAADAFDAWKPTGVKDDGFATIIMVSAFYDGSATDASSAAKKIAAQLRDAGLITIDDSGYTYRLTPDGRRAISRAVTRNELRYLRPEDTKVGDRVIMPGNEGEGIVTDVTRDGDTIRVTTRSIDQRSALPGRKQVTDEVDSHGFGWGWTRRGDDKPGEFEDDVLNATPERLAALDTFVEAYKASTVGWGPLRNASHTFWRASRDGKTPTQALRAAADSARESRDGHPAGTDLHRWLDEFADRVDPVNTLSPELDAPDVDAPDNQRDLTEDYASTHRDGNAAPEPDELDFQPGDLDRGDLDRGDDDLDATPAAAGSALDAQPPSAPEPETPTAAQATNPDDAPAGAKDDAKVGVPSNLRVDDVVVDIRLTTDERGGPTVIEPAELEAPPMDAPTAGAPSSGAAPSAGTPHAERVAGYDRAVLAAMSDENVAQLLGDPKHDEAAIEALLEFIEVRETSDRLSPPAAALTASSETDPGLSSTASHQSPGTASAAVDPPPSESPSEPEPPSGVPPAPAGPAPRGERMPPHATSTSAPHDPALPAAPAAGHTLVIEHTQSGTLLFGTRRTDSEVQAVLRRDGWKWSNSIAPEVGQSGAWYLPRRWLQTTRDTKVQRLTTALDQQGRSYRQVKTPDWRLTAAVAPVTAARTTPDRPENPATNSSERSASADAAAQGGRMVLDPTTGGDPLAVLLEQSIPIDDDLERDYYAAARDAADDLREVQSVSDDFDRGDGGDMTWSQYRAYRAELDQPAVEQAPRPEPAPPVVLASEAAAQDPSTTPDRPAAPTGQPSSPASALPSTPSAPPSSDSAPQLALSRASGRAHDPQLSATVRTIEEGVDRLRKDIEQVSAALDVALAQAGQSRSDAAQLTVAEAAWQLLDAVLAASRRQLDRVSKALPEWQQIDDTWERAGKLWDQVRVAASGAGPGPRLGQLLRTFVTGVLAEISKFARRAAERVRDSALLGRRDRAVLTAVAETTGAAAERLGDHRDIRASFAELKAWLAQPVAVPDAHPADPKLADPKPAGPTPTVLDASQTSPAQTRQTSSVQASPAQRHARTDDPDPVVSRWASKFQGMADLPADIADEKQQFRRLAYTVDRLDRAGGDVQAALEGARSDLPPGRAAEAMRQRILAAHPESRPPRAGTEHSPSAARAVPRRPPVQARAVRR